MTLHQRIQLFHRRRPIQILTLAAALLAVGLYAWIYRFAPLPEYWNTLVGDVLTILVAVAAAVTGTILIQKFEPGEKPRTIWLWFTLGWWSWVIGEIATTVYDIFNIAYGDLSVFDIFWTLGYLCFGLALYLQFRQIYGRNTKFQPVKYILMIVAALLVTLGLTQLALQVGLGADKSWFALYLAIFYPVGDVFIGLAALWLSFVFGRGSWGRPWWALIVFAVADAGNTFWWIAGNKLSENASGLLDWISNVIYNSGYVVAMFGFLSILLYYMNLARSRSVDSDQPPA